MVSGPLSPPIRSLSENGLSRSRRDSSLGGREDVSIRGAGASAAVVSDAGSVLGRTICAAGIMTSRARSVSSLTRSRELVSFAASHRNPRDKAPRCNVGQPSRLSPLSCAFAVHVAEQCQMILKSGPRRRPRAALELRCNCPTQRPRVPEKTKDYAD